MQFEYDWRKSESNLEKHGIDFEEAQELWAGNTVTFKANVRGENRFKVIGKISNEYWTAVFTERSDRVRIISARRATQKEKSVYDKYID